MLKTIEDVELLQNTHNNSQMQDLKVDERFHANGNQNININNLSLDIKENFQKENSAQLTKTHNQIKETEREIQILKEPLDNDQKE